WSSPIVNREASRPPYRQRPDARRPRQAAGDTVRRVPPRQSLPLCRHHRTDARLSGCRRCDLYCVRTSHRDSTGRRRLHARRGLLGHH
ncbi:Os02g0702300, partial [Oryza sativa Japonica Group]